MLVKDKFRAGRNPSQEDLVGSLAVSAAGDPMDVSAAVSGLKLRDQGGVSYRLRFYTAPEDVADPETGEFHGGIEATPFHDWSFTVQLLDGEELKAAREEVDAMAMDFFFSVPVPELGLTLFGSGHTG